MNYTILIAEDHPLYQKALTSIVNSTLQNTSIIEADSFESMQQAIESHAPPNLILLDLNIPGAYGFSSLIFIKKNHPAIPVLVISADDKESTIIQSIAYGASGFVSKTNPADVLKEAIPHVFAGGSWVPDHIDISKVDEIEKTDIENKIGTLTAQQFRVLGMINEGLLNKQIAFELDISEATIKAHVSAIFKKLGIKNRTQAVLVMQKLAIEQQNNETT